MKNNIITYVVNKEDENKSFKEILKNNIEISTRLLTKLKENKCITRNNDILFVNEIARNGDIIEIDFSRLSVTDNENIVSENILIDIIYEDDWILIVNKPPFMAVHPSALHRNNTLANAIKFYYNKTNQKCNIHIVNRLDKDTSGIVIFAKNQYIQECLIKQMQQNIMVKEYLAILEGEIDFEYKHIQENISRKPGSIIEREVNKSGKYASTEIYNIKIIEDKTNNKKYSYVRCKLNTGRTHQIRIHTKHIGHPILSDGLYGNSISNIERQALHSYSIRFIHPIKKVIIKFEIDVPKDMQEILRKGSDK